MYPPQAGQQYGVPQYAQPPPMYAPAPAYPPPPAPTIINVQQNAMPMAMQAPPPSPQPPVIIQEKSNGASSCCITCLLCIILIVVVPPIIMAIAGGPGDVGGNGGGNDLAEYSICDYQEVSGAGIITSPNYPDNYDGNADCSMTLYGEGQDINIEFEYFDVEFSGGCNYDYLKLDDETYCGTISPFEISFYSTQINLLWHTDSSVHAGGFRIRFTSGGYDPSNAIGVHEPEILKTHTDPNKVDPAAETNI